MSESPPMKKSEVLAIENVKRIADQLRSERNDAWAVAQVQRERADSLATLLRDIRDVLAAGRDVLEKRPELKIVEVMARVDNALKG